MIRPAVLPDVAAILEIYRPYIEQTTVTFEYDVPTAAQFTERFQTITAQYPWLVWEEQGEILGYAYGSPAFERTAFQWTADLSVYLREEARGRGIGRSLYEAVEQLLRRQGYCLCYGVVTDENTGSRAFHLAMGYRELAVFPRCAYKFGRPLGIVWYEKCLRTEIPAQPPVSWRQLPQEETEE